MHIKLIDMYDSTGYKRENFCLTEALDASGEANAIRIGQAIILGLEHCNTKNISSRMGIERAAPRVAKTPRRKNNSLPFIRSFRSPPLPIPISSSLLYTNK